jgi:hypothetical protein
MRARNGKCRMDPLAGDNLVCRFAGSKVECGNTVPMSDIEALI